MVMSASHEHIVRSYDAELARLTHEIAAMGERAAALFDEAMEALERRDNARARRVIAGDAAIDAQEREVSHDVLRLLALRQPIARDLREILAALRIASDIERIGDYATNVGKRTLALNRTAPVQLADGLDALAALASALVREVLRAYVARDAERARAAWLRDAELDALYSALCRELMVRMNEEPRSIAACTHLLFIAKHIERIGDHATNIAENVWFTVRGEPLAETRRYIEDFGDA